MKVVVLVGDGMGDYPVESLGGKSPLQAAHSPGMRRIAARGRIHRVSTVPEGLPPGSDVCNLGLLGYNAKHTYTGRAPIEAAGAGIPLGKMDVAFRCNLVTVRDGKMIDYSAGHISTEEGASLLRALSDALGTEQIRFHEGISYRHLVIWENGPVDLVTEPPHEISLREVAPYLPRGKRQDEVRDLMDQSKSLFAEHPVNQARVAQGHDPASQIWLWGQGRALSLSSFESLYGLTGGVVTAVDLVRGIGRLAGLETPVIPGVTGFIDTNYAGKVEATRDILARHDFAYVHIEAPDECGHMGDAELKTKAIEAFDAQVVIPVWDHLESLGEPYRLIIAMDHRTPVSLRGHTSDPVPLAVLDGPVGPLTQEAPFDETCIESLPDEISYALMPHLFAC